jgi:PKD repeat protein
MNRALSLFALGLWTLAPTPLLAQNSFTDFFEQANGPPDDWSVSSGSWSVVDDQLRCEVSDAWIWAGTTPIDLDGDFELSIEVRFPTIPGDGVGRHGGIMFFASSATSRLAASGYTLDWIDRASDHGFRLIRWTNGSATQTLVNGTAGISEPPSLWELSIVGNQIILRGDGEDVFTVVDDNYRTGHFGLWSYSNSAMLFDNVEIFTGAASVRSCFTAAPSSGDAPLDVDFDGSCSSDGDDESIVEFDWEFGDGSGTSGETVSHVFNTAGSYSVTLTVVGDAGATRTSSRTIDVFDPDDVPDFDVDRILNERVKRYGAEADSTVVFNEVMYHPSAQEAQFEWFELYNQMAVDMDLSNWVIGEGVYFEIPLGTILAGGGFLVIARDPDALAAASGVDALGPFTGRLDNGGEDLRLFNRSGREMAGFRYNDDGGWPVAPDGSGVSLAKLDPLSASGPPQNWTGSAQLGGTPGGPNFPTDGGAPDAELPLVAFNEYDAAAFDDYSIELVNHGDSAVDLEDYEIAPGNLAGYRFPATVLGAGEFLVLSRADLGFDFAVDGKLFLYTPDGQRVVDAMKLDLGNEGRFTRGVGEWLRPDTATLGAANSFSIDDSIVINEIHYHPRLEPARDDVFERTLLFGIETDWRYEVSGDDLGTSWRAAGFDDDGWPVDDAVFYRESGDLPAPKRTEIDLGPITFYFRKTFDVPDPVDGVLQLRLLIDDGAVVYINGSEVLRANMPAGAVSASTLAAAGVSNAVFTGPFSLPTGSLNVGTNVIAVEVHQASTNSSDVVFAAELVASVLTEMGHPSREHPESWVELYHRGDRAVDLSGWDLDVGVDYTFEPGTLMQPGDYLVVAEDVDVLSAKYPGARIVGDFGGRLSNRRDRIVLRDAQRNPVDEVEYFDAGRWPSYADGGGSSLELRDPDADNDEGEAWAASDETGRSAWRTYSYRQVATANVGPTRWREFVIGLLDAGEVLLDDISVVQSPDSGPRQLLQNGDFETGESAWRILGNHDHSAVIEDPDSPGNSVLHLVATGPTEHMHNHLETTLVNNSSAPNGVEYEVSFRARWLAGSNQLNTRLYFNRIPRTTLIDVPEDAGTPGAENSTREPNIGPTYDKMAHAPVVPRAGESVTVSIFASDPDGVAQMTLWYSVAGGAWRSAAMSLVAGTSTLYTGRVPGQSASRIVQLYVEGEDALDATSTFPAAGRDSRALFKVEDGQSRTGPIHNFRIIMTAPDVSSLHAETNVMSNERLGATVVYREEEIFYDVSCRLKGSQRGRLGGHRVSFSVRFHPDALFRGAHRTVSLDRSGGWGIGAGPTGQDEIIVKHAINQAGLPGMYDDIAWLVAPRSSENGPALVMMSKYSSVFRRTQYPGDSGGTTYKNDLIYYPTTTVGGDPEGLKRPQPDVVVGSDLRDLGDDKESYRWTFLMESNVRRDDYSRFIDLCKVMSSSSSGLGDRMEEVLDIDEATRMYAVHTLCGISDSWWFGFPHNVMFFELENEGRFVILGWDDDVAFTRGTTSALWGGPNLARLYSIPKYQRLFYGHLKDIVDDFYSTALMRRWTDHYGELAQEPGSFGRVLTYIGARSNFARGALPPQINFEITTNGGNDFIVDDLVVSIEGRGWIDVRGVLIAGRDEPQELDWPTRESWRTSVSLDSGENELAFVAFDLQGDVVGTDIISVTSTAEPPPDEFIRGDANRDLVFDVSDAVATLLHLFGGQALTCLDAADVNDDESVSISDATYSLSALFRGGQLPPAPFPAPGVDPTGDGTLGCEE